MQRFLGGALAGALFFCAGLAGAGEISVNPIRIELGAGQRTASLTVTNNGDKATVIQVTVKQWQQPGGEHVYEPTKEVIATPVLFRVAPRGQQLIRVGFPNPPSEITTERSYRIYLTEVPEEKSGDAQIRFLLQLGVPMFVAPAQPQDRLDWKVSRQADGKLQLSAENHGNRHVRIQGIRIEDSRGPLIEQQDLQYLLAGGRRTWLLAPTRAPADESLRLKAQSGRGPLEAVLPSGPR